jgi:hypothetical protein
MGSPLACGGEFGRVGSGEFCLELAAQADDYAKKNVKSELSVRKGDYWLEAKVLGSSLVLLF